MGFRLRKAPRFAKYLRLNLSKTGVSVSVGKPGTTYNQPIISTQKRKSRTTIGLPGSGLSYRFDTGRSWRSPAWLSSMWGWIVLGLVVFFLLQWLVR